ELKNKIELARQEEALINQRGQNEQRRMTEQAEAQRIEVEAQAQQTKVQSAAEAESIRTVGSATAETEKAKIAVYRDLPTNILLGLAARELAQNPPAVEHLVLSPDILGPALTKLAQNMGQ
ncbi:MAG: band 7 protein, partial [Proteobacteria bacterium]|nr:band 7 protein [Pseudomonadota bacterium]